MALAPLATLADVQNLAGQPFTSQQQTYITNLLATASGIVRSYCRQAFSQVLADTITFAGNSTDTFVLPQRPVTAVSSVVVRGSAIPTGSYYWDRFGVVRLVSGSSTWNDFDNIYGPNANLGAGNTVFAGAPMLTGPAGSVSAAIESGPYWSGPTATITVTYDHGYATIPSEIVNEVAGMVSAQMSVPTGILNETIGNYKVGYIRAPGGGMTLTADAKDALNRYRVTSAASSVASFR